MRLTKARAYPAVHALRTWQGGGPRGSELLVEACGARTPVVLVHGSLATGTEDHPQNVSYVAQVGITRVSAGR
jgi:hypothetical protein